MKGRRWNRFLRLEVPRVRVPFVVSSGRSGVLNLNLAGQGLEARRASPLSNVNNLLSEGCHIADRQTLWGVRTDPDVIGVTSWIPVRIPLQEVPGAFFRRSFHHCNGGTPFRVEDPPFGCEPELEHRPFGGFLEDPTGTLSRRDVVLRCGPWRVGIGTSGWRSLGCVCRGSCRPVGGPCRSSGCSFLLPAITAGHLVLNKRRDLSASQLSYGFRP